jgi:hypothetical protein
LGALGRAMARPFAMISLKFTHTQQGGKHEPME